MRFRNYIIRALALTLALSVVPLAQAVAAPAGLPVTFTSAGQTFHPPATLVTSGTVDIAGVNNWVVDIAGRVDSKPVNASLVVNKKKRRLDFKASKPGYTLDRNGSVRLIIAALTPTTSTSPPMPHALPTTRRNPRIARFGKIVLVSLVQRKIYLYSGSRVEKTYRCAVGQSHYPTPTGTFRIGKKVKNPSWTNGQSSWSRNMPAYLAPSPNNPLGTRALYVYNGRNDTGVRFHGVPPSEDSSIGHAASHGCLRMHRRDVENFYPRVPVGTAVYIIK